MGYTQPPARQGSVRRVDGPTIEIPGLTRAWWEEHLGSSVAAGFGDLRWFAPDGVGSEYVAVAGVYHGRMVSIRLPNGFEGRGGEAIGEEVMTNVEVRPTPPELGLWVMEAPPKWFRRRRAWALNRPPFSTGDPWFDEHAGCWAWDTTQGAEALRAALMPSLPTIREILDTQPGAIVTNTTISAWIPHAEMSERLPRLLSLARSFPDS
jgi:hypothetical protein